MWRNMIIQPGTGYIQKASFISSPTSRLGDEDPQPIGFDDHRNKTTSRTVFIMASGCTQNLQNLFHRVLLMNLGYFTTWWNGEDHRKPLVSMVSMVSMVSRDFFVFFFVWNGFCVFWKSVSFFHTGILCVFDVRGWSQGKHSPWRMPSSSRPLWQWKNRHQKWTKNISWDSNRRYVTVCLFDIYIYTYDFDFLHLTGFLIGPFSTRRWNLHFPPGHCRSQGQGAVWSSKHLAWYAEFLGAARPQRTLRKIDVGLRKPAVWKMHFSNWMWPLNPWLFFGGSSWNLGFVFFCWWMKRCWLLEVWRYAFFWWNGIVCWVWKALSPLF